MFSKVVLISALTSSAFATVFITSPTATTTFTGGQQATISWIDSNGGPSLQDWGNAKVSVYTGNANQQTMLQQVVPSVNVATTSSVQFTPDASIGPNGQEYFIRIESLTLKDANNTQYPQMSFSALFTMAGMSGQFNSSVQAQIDGQSTAPIGGSTTGSVASATSTPSTTSKASSASSSASATKNATSTTAAAVADKSNGAISSAVSNMWTGAVFGPLLLALML